MVSPTLCTWVWVNSKHWWWTGRPGVLWFMESQRVGHDWATELNWTERSMTWTLLNWILHPRLETSCGETKIQRPLRQVSGSGGHGTKMICEPQLQPCWWGSRAPCTSHSGRANLSGQQCTMEVTALSTGLSSGESSGALFLTLNVFSLNLLQSRPLLSYSLNIVVIVFSDLLKQVAGLATTPLP